MKNKAFIQRMATTFLSVFLFISFLFAQKNNSYVVDITKIKAPVPGTLWGLFFEDINRSADGGVYAELVKNRSFDFPDPFTGWTSEPSRRAYDRNDIFQVINQSATRPNDPKYLQVTINKPEKIFLANDGFGGIALKKGEQYDLEILYRRQISGIIIRAALVNAAGKVVSSATVNPNPDSNDWQVVKTSFVTNDTTIKGQLVLYFEGTGKLDIDRVSLFPKEKWKGKANQLRADLVQKLADIKPGFLRFPGGCIVEGRNLSGRYQWKTTIGPLEERKLMVNLWQERGAEAGKPLPDYFQSFGLGFYEYFLLCEDLNTEPLPILNCGISCQFEGAEVVPLHQIDAYLQDALDLIEFANGDINTQWGARRAALGHVEPFHLKMIGVGNENWGPQYVERLEIFTKAIKEKYPYMKIVTSTGYSPEKQFRYMDSVLRKKKVDIIDEHYYAPPEWFFMNAGKYDNYDRKGPRIFLGEYSSQSVAQGSPDNKNTTLCALAEAAFMTGLERNADIVAMAAYAPLFAHVKDWQWTPNLIWFDNSTSYATPSYYVQQLFSLNKGTHVVPITENGNAIAGVDSVWASAVIDKNTNEVIIKLVNPSGGRQKTIRIPGLKKMNTTGTITILKGDANDVNSLEQPSVVKPASTNVEIKNRKVKVNLEANSFNVIKIKMN